MAEEELQKEVEAILFSSGRKVSLEELSKLCKVKDIELIKEAVNGLQAKYGSQDSSLLLIEESDGWKLTVREKYITLVKDINPHTELNKALLETLAIVAWKQPLMQADLVKYRTSKAYEHIKELLEMGFISKEKKGRTFTIKPTGRFFDYFDLPGKEAMKEVFKQVEEEHKKAEQEITGKVGQLEVYNLPEEKKEGAKAEEENKEKVGPFEVYEEPQAETANASKSQEIREEAEEMEGGAEEVPQEEEPREEQAQAEEEAPTETPEMIEEPPEEEQEEQKGEGSEEGQAPEKNEQQDIENEDSDEDSMRKIAAKKKSEEKELKERKLSPILEKFAGIEQQPEEEKNEEAEEAQEESGGDGQEEGSEVQSDEEGEEKEEQEEDKLNIDEMIKKHGKK